MVVEIASLSRSIIASWGAERSSVPAINFLPSASRKVGVPIFVLLELTLLSSFIELIERSIN